MLKNKIIKICGYIIEGGILAIVFFVPVIFDFTLTYYNANLLKAVVFRVILSLILLAYAAKVFMSGKISLRASSKIFLPALILLASWFLSSLLSLHPNISFWGSYERTQGFYSLANYLLFFSILVLNFKSLKQIKRLIAAVILAGALSSLYGLIQLFGLDNLPWKESGFATGRIFSSLGQPNFFGQYLIMIMPLTLYGLLFIAKKFLTKFFIFLVILAELACLVNTYSRAAWIGFLAAAGLFILIYLPRQKKVFDQVRGVINCRSRWSNATDKRLIFTRGLLIKKRKIAAIGFCLIILMSAGLILSLNFAKINNPDNLDRLNFLNRLKSLVDIKSGSSAMRLYYWQGAISEIKSAGALRLVFGYGPDALADVFVKYYRPDWAIYENINTFPDRAHNWLFDNILAYGLVGLAAVLLFYFIFIFKTAVWLFGQAIKPKEEVWLAVALAASLAAYFVNNLFSFSLFTCFVYLYLILAMLWFLAGHGEEREIKLALTPAAKILIWLALALVAGLYVYLYNINYVRADNYYMKAKKAEKKGDCQGIIDNLEKAVAYGANNMYYKEQYIFYGLNCLAAVSGRDSRLNLRANILAQINLIKPRDYDYLVWLTVARAYSLFGFYVEPADYAEAEKIFQDLISRYPNLLTAYQDFGRMKMWQKDYAGALSVFKRAEEILPPLNHPRLNRDHGEKISAEAVSLYEKMGYSYDKLKNYDLALKYYLKALALNPFRASLYKSIADIYYEQGGLDKAIVLNKRGFTLNPADYHWPWSLSLLYREKKDLAEAKKYLDQAIRLAPESAELKKY